MRRCNKNNCSTCPYVKVGTEVQAWATEAKVKINASGNCDTTNLIYCITCNKCNQNYIGETKRPLKVRFGEHLGYVRNKKLNEPTGHHFNLPGHNITMMEITLLEKIWSSSTNLRKIRESKYIQDFDSFYNGINQRRCSSKNKNKIPIFTTISKFFKWGFNTPKTLKNTV